MDNKDQQDKSSKETFNTDVLLDGLKFFVYSTIYAVASTRVGPKLICYVAKKFGYELSPELN